MVTGSPPSRKGLATIGELWASNQEPVPHWKDAYKDGVSTAQRAEIIRQCSRGIWYAGHRLATSGSTDFAPATLHADALNNFTLGKPGDGGIPGSSWISFLTPVYVSLWPDLHRLIGIRAPEKLTGTESSRDLSMAMSFRSETSKYLKNTRNLCMVRRSSGRVLDSGQPVTLWFIRGEWNDGVPLTMAKKLTGPASGKAAENARLERKLTPHEAGEDREPAPVERKFICRWGDCQPHPPSFSSEEERSTHEQTHRRPGGPQAGKPRTTGITDTFPCRVCGIGYISKGGRKSHERTAHPDDFRRIYPFPCPFSSQGCSETFEAPNLAVQIAHHIGKGGPHRIDDKILRDKLIGAVVAGKSAESLLPSSAKPESSVRTTDATVAETPSAASSRPSGPTQASTASRSSAIPVPATASAEDAEDVAISYISSLIDSVRAESAVRISELETANKLYEAKLQALTEAEEKARKYDAIQAMLRGDS